MPRCSANAGFHSRRFCPAWYGSLFLVFLVFIAFQPTLNNGYSHLDDTTYVFHNDRVLSGITLKNAAWAFSTFEASNWHPLAWLSHMLDISLFGPSPSRHHLTSLLFHAANTAMLFILFRVMTGFTWRSLAAAALFGVHPLRVESVAWISERKDVLSVFFMLPAAMAWLAYLRRSQTGPRRFPYALSCFLYACALMAKPMPVSFPFLLLILDFWPLGRAASTPLGRRLVEKLPFFMLAAVSSALTYAAQFSSDLVRSLRVYPWWVRAANAPLAYLGYLRRTLWPSDLHLPYLHAGRDIPLTASVAAGTLLILAGLLCHILRQRHPYLAGGWLWFLGTLVPVIGLVQVADQSMADRYTYLPAIGLVLALVWLSADLAARLPGGRAAAAVTAAAALTALVPLTYQQTRLWHDDITLFGHTVRLDPDNHLGHRYLAESLANDNRHLEALPYYGQALRIDAYADPEVYYRYSISLAALERWREAVDQLNKYLWMKPASAKGHVDLGMIFAKTGRLDEAMRHYATALRFEPDNAVALNNMGASYLDLQRPAEAVPYLEKSLRIKPDYILARNNLSRARFMLSNRP